MSSVSQASRAKNEARNDERIAVHHEPSWAPPTALCELRDASVAYGARYANQGVSLQIGPGEVVALLGENGAGKSTALHALYGLLRLSGGAVCYGGTPCSASPERAIAAGIGLVSQHFLLIPRLTVAENIVLGHEPRRYGLLDRSAAHAAVEQLAASYGLQVDPARRVSALSVGEAQRVEILKALYRGARCLLLDEPTAVLSPAEALTLLRALRSQFVAPRKTGLLIVTHKLDEVLEIADRAVILRGGQVVASYTRAEFSPQEMARDLVGQTLVPVERQPPAQKSAATEHLPAKPCLVVRDLRVTHEGVTRLDGICFDLFPGQIVGIAGVEGNGQTELALALAGLLPTQGGSVTLYDQDLLPMTTHQRREAGLTWVLEDRQRHGLVLDFSLRDNLLLGEAARYRHRLLSGWIDGERLQDAAQDLLTAFDVRPPDPSLPARSLSGGNQQKLLFARALGQASQRTASRRVLMVCQPTRGVDIGAIAAIHRLLLSARDEGCAILLISSELDELRSLCDHIAVLYRGRLAATLPNPAEAPLSREALGELLAGLSPRGR